MKAPVEAVNELRQHTDAWLHTLARKTMIVGKAEMP